MIRKHVSYVSTLGAAALLVAACESGDINLQPTNVDNSVDNSTTSTSTSADSSNPCASHMLGDDTRQGSFDGTNCTYGPSFVSFSNPLTTDLSIPFITGVHIFQDTLAVGENVESGTAPAGGTGPTLTIAPGATLAFLDSSDYLLINRGATIMADGSPTAPITLTGYTDAVSDTAGPEDVALWGGVVINGNGITNNCSDQQRTDGDCHVTSEGQPSNYGGNDNTESSGTLRYVVVKHTGYEVAAGDELNGITFNAVGSGTVVSHIQTYSTFDDGIEFFGGAVDVANYIALYVRDDSIDFSDGYVGTIDTALVIHSQTDGNRCVEGDNVGSGARVGGGRARYDAADQADDQEHDLHPVQQRRRHSRSVRRHRSAPRTAGAVREQPHLRRICGRCRREQRVLRDRRWRHARLRPKRRHDDDQFAHRL